MKRSTTVTYPDSKPRALTKRQNQVKTRTRKSCKIIKIRLKTTFNKKAFSQHIDRVLTYQDSEISSTLSMETLRLLITEENKSCRL